MRKQKNQTNVMFNESYSNAKKEIVIGLNLSVSHAEGLWLSLITEGDATATKPLNINVDSDELRKIAKKIEGLAQYLDG